MGAEVELVATNAAAGTVEIEGVGAGEFDPALWEKGELNLVPDVRSPFLAPQPGKFRNIYGPAAVEVPGGYRVFYGAWDGVDTPNDRVYSVRADPGFRDFSQRRVEVLPGPFTHACNPSAIRLEDGSFALMATLFAVEGLNKPAFFRSDASGMNWNGSTNGPHKTAKEDLAEIAGYNFAGADINGMNVLLREDGKYRLYFGDFKNPGVFRASGTDGKHFAFDAKVLPEGLFVNDVKKFRVGGTNFYLMGMHRNDSRLWSAVSADGLAFSSAREILKNLGEADRYIVALGWVTRGEKQLLGVLYGAGPVPSLDQNAIYARWLQKRVVFVEDDGTRITGTRALGPGKQLLYLPGGKELSGRLEVYGEDGRRLVSRREGVTLRGGGRIQFSSLAR